jgi:hypothetical protein
VGDGNTVVVARHWHRRSGELAFVTRTIAGASSRLGPVAVLVPGTFGSREPDGAFDLLGMGEEGHYRWPDGLSVKGTLVVDDLTTDVVDLISRSGPTTTRFYLSSSVERPDPTWHAIPLVPGRGRPFVGTYVPVHPMAAGHRHGGFGFTDYLLVLSDGSGAAGEPPSAAAWLTAAFHEQYVVVVDTATAWAWKGRSLRGSASVDTRMDLWRLVAHALACIDVAPGEHVARECVEALRLGTPIVVPDESGVAAIHATASGGCTYRDPGDLVAHIAFLQDETERSTASAHATRYADAHYGDPEALVARLGVLFGVPERPADAADRDLGGSLG